MERKTSTLANFNCTFGEENEPMLNYLREIIYPAFKSKLKRKVYEDVYFFEDVSIKEVSQERYALVGIFVKKTKLEVKTEYDYSKGVTFTNKFYDAAPISIFTIFLDNHRMIYTTNQKGSPDIRSFNATVKDIVNQYIRRYNNDKDENEKLPYPAINIVNLPSEKDVKEKLRDVKKIKKLTFKLFNPNGDFNISDTYDGLLEQLEEAGSKQGSFVINSPTKFNNVADMITDTRGLAEAKLEVEYTTGGKGTIDHETMGEKIAIELPSETSIETVSNIVTDTLKVRAELQMVSDENKEIYDNNRDVIIGLMVLDELS
jgi:hypothetical protein